MRHKKLGIVIVLLNAFSLYRIAIEGIWTDVISLSGMITRMISGPGILGTLYMIDTETDVFYYEYHASIVHLTLIFAINVFFYFALLKLRDLYIDKLTGRRGKIVKE